MRVLKERIKLPMLSEMLKKLEGKAPQIALDQLLELKQYSWKPLSSYVHGGKTGQDNCREPDNDN